MFQNIVNVLYNRDLMQIRTFVITYTVVNRKQHQCQDN